MSLVNCLRGKAKGGIVGKRPFAAGAFEPQDPGAEDTDTILNDESEGASSAIMQAKGVLGSLGGTMGACVGIASVLAGLQILCVTVDFLFCVHKLEDSFWNWGTRRDRQRHGVPPFFYSPSNGRTPNRNAQERGAGSSGTKIGARSRGRGHNRAGSQLKRAGSQLNRAGSQLKE